MLSVCVCFALFKFVSGLILWFMADLWFDDLRAGLKIGDRLNVVFKPDVILCGCLGSNYQLSNY